METITPAGLPPRDAPAPDVTGPDITPAGLPPRAEIVPARPMSASALVLAALVGVGLASLIGNAGLMLRRLPGPLPSRRSGEL